jgi:hypothetical protein
MHPRFHPDEKVFVTNVYICYSLIQKYSYVYAVISSEESSGNMLPVIRRRLTKSEPIYADVFITLTGCYCGCYYCKYWNSALCRAWLYVKFEVWFINISAVTLSSSVFATWKTHSNIRYVNVCVHSVQTYRVHRRSSWPIIMPYLHRLHKMYLWYWSHMCPTECLRSKLLNGQWWNFVLLVFTSTFLSEILNVWLYQSNIDSIPTLR